MPVKLSSIITEEQATLSNNLCKKTASCQYHKEFSIPNTACSCRCSFFHYTDIRHAPDPDPPIPVDIVFIPIFLFIVVSRCDPAPERVDAEPWAQVDDRHALTAIDPSLLCPPREGQTPAPLPTAHGLLACGLLSAHASALQRHLHNLIYIPHILHPLICSPLRKKGEYESYYNKEQDDKLSHVKLLQTSAAPSISLFHTSSLFIPFYISASMTHYLSFLFGCSE